MRWSVLDLRWRTGNARGFKEQEAQAVKHSEKAQEVKHTAEAQEVVIQVEGQRPQTLKEP